MNEAIATHSHAAPLYNNLAAVLERAGKYDVARTTAEHGTHEDAGLAQLHKNLGDLHYRAARYDYALRASSPCRHAGRRPGRAQGFSLVPRFQFAGVAGLARRTDGGTIAGAFGQTGA